jgi:hypothetical protein
MAGLIPAIWTPRSDVLNIIDITGHVAGDVGREVSSRHPSNLRMPGDLAKHS